MPSQDDGQRASDSCRERLTNAVESLLLCPDAFEGLEKAFGHLLLLRPEDFPTEGLRTAFASLVQRHNASIDEYCRVQGVADSHAVAYLRYAMIPSDTKHWLRQQIWELYRESLAAGEPCG